MVPFISLIHEDKHDIRKCNVQHDHQLVDLIFIISYGLSFAVRKGND